MKNAQTSLSKLPVGERYAQLLDAMDEGFCVCEMLLDEQGTPYNYRFLEVNASFERQAGLSDIVGKTLLEVLPGETHWIEAYRRAAIQRETIRFEQDSEKLGRWFEAQAFPLGEPEQRTFAILFRDISARRNAELALLATNEELVVVNDNLSRTNEQLLRVNADLDNFIYIASHDLKAPISNITGLLEILKQNLPPDCLTSNRTQQTLQMMERSVERFMSTISEMSDIARLQKQGDQPSEEVSLANAIEEVRQDLALAIEQANAQLDIRTRACGPIQFAPKNLRSVVYNLLSNAIKYRDPTRLPIINISCQSEGNYQVLVVQDNGLGMDLSGNHRLFGLFQRLHDHVEGTGIGLYIVKKVVEDAGGKITVDSQVGRGTTFRVYFKH